MSWNAARGGSVDCLRYVMERDCRGDEKTCNIAASYGHLDCLR